MNTNQREKVALITGANAGIGLELTRKLLSEGWQVAALIRSAFPADDALISQAANSGQLRIYQASDLSDFDSLKQALDEVKARETYIDVLFNNAGGSFPELRFSAQGRELHYELMTVAPYIILMELQELLKNGRHKTVINTSSAVTNMVKPFDPDSLDRPKTFRKLLGPYATSKLALSLWTQAAAPEFAKEGIKIRSVDPGSNNTARKSKKSGLPWYVKPMMKLFFQPPSYGAGRLYDGALGPHGDLAGVYLEKGRVKELNYTKFAQKVLNKVKTVYEREYLKSE
ncbi:SDR family NAD(P)-dependent oxidoreductase [Paenibacillus macerans]|uniref:SDR family NAD(P)-dependent oxidoreductase n=1 Tax=Paenibacillus macerans TaxID=44252 RepID=UPI00203B54DB|nr:SDR family NAD(P)-dependent oxidoreductase [Paenibacillus macerans]MCM3698620.1 SDR family NAD(P)-dependent oxidoreductase [Paenibacillus macerans]